MGQAYGKSLTWSTAGAPHPFSGICEDFSYKDALQVAEVAGETDLAAMVLHGAKGDISFNTIVTDASTDFLNLQNGVKLAISGISAGVILVSQCVEKWTIGSPKTAGITAVHFPDMTDSSGASAEEISAFTPEQTGLIIRPAGKVIWGTAGLTHTSGMVSSLTLTQSVNIQEEADEFGKIVAAYVSNYKRTIDLQLVSTGTKPVKGEVLTVTGAPAHAAGYIITGVEEAFRKGDKKGYSVQALWTPVFDEEDEGDED